MNYLQKKKLAFMSIVNKVKGFIRTITGALPLTLEGCVDEESIIDYTLYGQSVQNGTPTPDTPVEVESVGEYDEIIGKYKIPIKVSGKNLFDMDNAMVSVDNWYYIGGSYSYGLNLEVGKQYRFSCDVINNPGVFIAAICRKPKIADWSYTTLYSMVGQSSTTGKKSYTFVADGTECLWLYHSGGGGLNLYKKYITENIKNIQIEEGATATDYEPYHEPVTTNIYLDEPLRKVGNYADYVDLENGKVVRNVKEVVLDGGENWVADTTKTVTQVFMTYDIYIRPPTDACFCDKFIFANPGDTEKISILHHIYIAVNKTRANNVTDFKKWLSENPTVVAYPLATPTETPITLPPIPTFKGTSIISADTTIQPSNVEITYYSNVKE